MGFFREREKERDLLDCNYEEKKEGMGKYLSMGDAELGTEKEEPVTEMRNDGANEVATRGNVSCIALTNTEGLGKSNGNFLVGISKITRKIFCLEKGFGTWEVDRFFRYLWIHRLV